MVKAEQQLQDESRALLDAAERTDREEDESYGKGKRGGELPTELRRKESRLAKIREAKAALEQEAREQAERDAEEARRKNAEREAKEKAADAGIYSEANVKAEALDWVDLDIPPNQRGQQRQGERGRTTEKRNRGGHAREAGVSCRQRRLPVPKGHRRARIRPNEVRQRHPTLPLPWARESQGRITPPPA